MILREEFLSAVKTEVKFFFVIKSDDLLLL